MDEVQTIDLPGLGTSVKLGVVKPTNPPRVLRLKTYLTRADASPPPPDVVDYTQLAATSLKRMYCNDRYGCCVISGKYHNLGVWSANDKAPIVLATDDEIVKAYNRLKAGRGDSGCVISDVLDAFVRSGLPAGGQVYKIDGYVAVDHTNKVEAQVANYLFGCLTIGIDLPAAWQQSAAPGAVWDVTNSRVVGGHDVSVVGYTPQGPLISTWGVVLTMTWAAFLSSRYVTECYAMLSPLWYGDDRLAPCGADADKLKSDLDDLKAGRIPPLPGSKEPEVIDWSQI